MKLKVGGNGSSIDGHDRYGPRNSALSNDEGPGDMNFSSMSSTGSGSSNSHQLSYSKMLQDFKSAIGRRQTPRHLSLLSRFLMGFIALTIILSSVDYSMRLKYLSHVDDIADLMILSESRNIKLTQLQMNIRSYINIANGLEFQSYTSKNLN
jgi:hypothetical protein